MRVWFGRRHDAGHEPLDSADTADAQHDWLLPVATAVRGLP
jgi:hypothetical protein